MDFKKGLEEINRRVPVISQIVFRRIKNKEPMKAKWEQLDANIKKHYPGNEGFSTLNFDMLLKGLVSLLLLKHLILVKISF